MIIKFKKLLDNAKTPEYAHPTDAGCDLSAAAMELSNTHVIYDTGLSVEIPEGYVGLIFPRSSVYKTGMSLTNSVGVIDSGYRGSIKVIFKLGEVTSTYRVGDRVCQLIILPYPKVTFEETESLSDSDRGDGGFGSTGK